MLAIGDIVRLHMGHFTMPADSRLPGVRVVVSAFLIRHPKGLFLFDTGIADGPEGVEALYHPERQPLDEALAAAGATAADVRLIANCHLHPDHSGGNHRFAGVPIFAQAREHAAALQPGYTSTGEVAESMAMRHHSRASPSSPRRGTCPAISHSWSKRGRGASSSLARR